jgi:hypothetical protein
MGDQTQDVSVDAIDDDVERFAQVGCAPRDRVEYHLEIGRRVRDDVQYFRGRRLLLQCLVTLAGEPSHHCLIARGDTRTAHVLRPGSVLYRLAGSHFGWLAACSGAPSHRPSQGPGVCGFQGGITAGFCRRRNGVKSQGCTAAILVGSCPLWVISRHDAPKPRCPLYPRKQTLLSATGMSALCQ